MKKINFTISTFFVLSVLTAVASGQITPENTPSSDALPALSKPVGCGLALRYIDDALNKAFSDESTIIFIVRTTTANDTALARVRSRNLRNYVRFRGFKEYEVVVDLETSGAERIDIFVRGELLYTLPVTRGDKFEFSDC